MENPAGSSGSLYGCGVLQENREKKPEVCRSVGTTLTGLEAPRLILPPGVEDPREGRPGEEVERPRGRSVVPWLRRAVANWRRRLMLVLLLLLVPLVVGYMTGVVPGVSDYAGSAVCASGHPPSTCRKAQQRVAWWAGWP